MTERRLHKALKDWKSNSNDPTSGEKLTQAAEAVIKSGKAIKVSVPKEILGQKGVNESQGMSPANARAYAKKTRTGFVVTVEPTNADRQMRIYAAGRGYLGVGHPDKGNILLTRPDEFKIRVSKKKKTREQDNE
jgi:hypothetical protein